MTLWLVRAPYGPRYRQGGPIVTGRIRGLADLVATIETVAKIRVIAAMTLLTGAFALMVGNAYQAQMPEFARDLGHGDPGMLYALLLGADASGAFLAGIVLEGSGLLQPRMRTALVVVEVLWCFAICAFAGAPTYPLALLCLFVAGFLELSFNSMAQSLVQLNAPAAVGPRAWALRHVGDRVACLQRRHRRHEQRPGSPAFICRSRSAPRCCSRSSLDLRGRCGRAPAPAQAD